MFPSPRSVKAVGRESDDTFLQLRQGSGNAMFVVVVVFVAVVFSCGWSWLVGLKVASLFPRTLGNLCPVILRTF